MSFSFKKLMWFAASASLAVALSGCAYTYDTADNKNGGNVVKDIGRDYTLTVLLLPMVIGGILAASSK